MKLEDNNSNKICKKVLEVEEATRQNPPQNKMLVLLDYSIFLFHRCFLKYLILLCHCFEMMTCVVGWIVLSRRFTAKHVAEINIEKGCFIQMRRNGESSKLCILRATALVIGYTTPCTDIDIYIFFFIFYLKDILQSVIGCPLIKKKQKKGFPEFVFYVQTGTSCMKWLDNAHMRLATAVANSFFYIPIYIAKANSKKALKLFVFFLFFFLYIPSLFLSL